MSLADDIQERHQVNFAQHIAEVLASEFPDAAPVFEVLKGHHRIDVNNPPTIQKLLDREYEERTLRLKQLRSRLEAVHEWTEAWARSEASREHRQQEARRMSERSDVTKQLHMARTIQAKTRRWVLAIERDTQASDAVRERLFKLAERELEESQAAVKFFQDRFDSLAPTSEIPDPATYKNAQVDLLRHQLEEAEEAFSEFSRTRDLIVGLVQAYMRTVPGADEVFVY